MYSCIFCQNLQNLHSKKNSNFLGINLTDNQDRVIMDFHGNSVHQVGFGNEKVIEAIKNQLDTLR